jgi:hypothetical protein
MTTTPKPKINSEGEKELTKVAEQFDAFDANVKQLTLDRMNAAPKQDIEPQTKISQNDISKSKDIYLKPERTIGCSDKFNEKFRDAYNFDKEYVQFIAEHKEIIGEGIEIWTKPYAGVPAQYWRVPVNKMVWGPRFLAEQIKRKSYSRLVMQQSTGTGSDGIGQYYGALAVDTKIQRLDALPVSTRKSIFMGAISV